MKYAQWLVISLAAAFAAGMLFVNVYNSIVDAPNWGRDIPDSINAAREYFQIANPGRFFRLASPVNQGLALIALIACWPNGRWPRILCIVGLACAIGADVMTFAYFYPRNNVMFVDPISNVDAIRSAWAGWSATNWIRSGVCAVNTICEFGALILVSRPDGDLNQASEAS